MFTSRSQEWTTPPSLVEQVAEEYGPVVLDAAADATNAVAESWLGPSHAIWARRDALADDWPHWVEGARRPGVVYLNPPFSDAAGQDRWLARARATAEAGGATVVALLPVRPDTQAWHNHVLGRAHVRLLKGRLKYGGCSKPASFPSALVSWGTNA